MKKVFSFCTAVGLIILIIPSLVFFGTNTDLFKINSARPYNPELLTKEEYESNNFYLVTDSKTNEVMKISPVEYIKGVVASEMPLLYEEEALKAQAVAAHSYALVHLDSYDSVLSTDPAVCQGYIPPSKRKELWGTSFEKFEKKLDTAVRQVINEVMTVDNKPILAAFHAISNGTTETAQTIWGREIPYLVAATSPQDKNSPEYESSVELSPLEISQAMQKKYPDIKFNKDKSKWFSDIKKSNSGTITSITVGNTTITGNELREVFSLRSATFDIRFNDNTFLFKVYCSVHGVGMSQFGANEMAKSGSDYKTILKHYYHDITITNIK